MNYLTTQNLSVIAGLTRNLITLLIIDCGSEAAMTKFFDFAEEFRKIHYI